MQALVPLGLRLRHHPKSGLLRLEGLLLLHAGFLQLEDHLLAYAAHHKGGLSPVQDLDLVLHLPIGAERGPLLSLHRQGSEKEIFAVTTTEAAAALLRAAAVLYRVRHRHRDHVVVAPQGPLLGNIPEGAVRVVRLCLVEGGVSVLRLPGEKRDAKEKGRGIVLPILGLLRLHLGMLLRHLIGGVPEA